ncbi:hypothetical protein ABZ897_50135 [Nonomuraea sp. NPDC046802]|uniref:hypothetical protein n=1 Tax=Nonomuraea sp. NPDC046802 TaxID=3154919 RepID=UPI00340C6DCC
MDTLVSIMVMHEIFRPPGISPSKLRQDRILDEAKHTADPVHLMRVFGISADTAMKYVYAAHRDLQRETESGLNVVEPVVRSSCAPTGAWTSPTCRLRNAGRSPVPAAARLDHPGARCWRGVGDTVAWSTCPECRDRRWTG